MYLYGASGHGKVVADILRSKGIVVDGFIDDNADLVSVYGIPVFHTAEMADELIRIPMHGQVESLNAAVAAALLMYSLL